MSENELQEYYIKGIIEASRDNKVLLFNNIKDLCSHEYNRGLLDGRLEITDTSIKVLEENQQLREQVRKLEFKCQARLDRLNNRFKQNYNKFNQVLNEIREYIENFEPLDRSQVLYILKRIDKVLGDENNDIE